MASRLLPRRLPSVVLRASLLAQTACNTGRYGSTRLLLSGVVRTPSGGQYSAGTKPSGRRGICVESKAAAASTSQTEQVKIAHSVADASGGGWRKAGGASRGAAREAQLHAKNKSFAMWMLAIAMGTVGMSYASVPLYRLFCQVTGFGGTVRRMDGDDDVETDLEDMEIVHGRPITVRFNADVSARVPWRFTPSQPDVTVLPGETALAFYVAENRSSVPITGIATYNVTPAKVVRSLPSIKRLAALITLIY
jgi:hypothetical protein